MKPILQALLLADHVYEDRVTGKKVVAGIFNRLGIPRLKPVGKAEGEEVSQSDRKDSLVPGGMHPGSPYAYVNLTNLHGKADLVMRYVDLLDNSVLLETQLTVESADPLTTIELVLPMPLLPTPHAGAYALELLCGNEPLGSHRIVVQELREHLS